MSILEPKPVISDRTKAILRAAEEATDYNPDIYVIGSAAVATYSPTEIEPDDLDLAIVGNSSTLHGALPRSWTTTMDPTITSGVTYTSPYYQFEIDLVVNKNKRADIDSLTVTKEVDLGDQVVKVRVLKAHLLRNEYQDLIDDELPGSKIEAARRKVDILKSAAKNSRDDDRPSKRSRYGGPAFKLSFE